MANGDGLAPGNQSLLRHDHPAGAGWINVKAIARGLNQPINEVEEEWGGLKAALR